ncbi:MAG: hypothetical protein O7E52_02985 [Candidatus Poribacteria bacterium]|nr:hypothetical protein [Candidatus Poribacteria bacterium]
MRRFLCCIFIGLILSGIALIYGCVSTAPKGNKMVSAFQYPEVPDDYPFSVIWRRPAEETEQIPLNELNQLDLLNLVMVKKWTEGDHDCRGGNIGENGKVYLNYPNVVYVKWEEDERPDGTIVKYPAKMQGGDSTIVEQVSNGILPPGVFVLDMDSAGIDAYQYLGIENPDKD